MRAKSVIAALVAVIALQAAPAPASEGEPGEEDFVSYMTRMQYFSHKLGLAVAGGSAELQHFYAHELEEIIEEVAEVEEFKGIEIGRLIRSTLIPAFESLEHSLGGEVGKVDAAYDAMLKSCNECHQASGFGFLTIERRPDNPYLQSFAPGR